MRFRADVEGLRGVAIGLVVLAHAGVPGFDGGVIGVDVFFVISGFLITSLLTHELTGKGAVDYWGFYARRAKRLLPALLVMLLAVGALAAALLPPSALPLQATTGMLAALWVSNFHFAFAQLDYFAPEAATSSLYLHTWSLGVEEQFYLVWPLILVMAWKWRPSSVRRETAVVGVVALFGFVLALRLYRTDPIAAYYLMPTRLWELALGGLAALLVRSPLPLHLRGRDDALRLVGLALVGLGVVAIRPGEGNLFAWLLLPVVGTALLLLAAGDPQQPLFRLLALPVLRFFGRISYAF